MKAARQKGIETIINPAPAIPLPDEAYQGLGHLIVNETEAAILSGIDKPSSWDEVAAIFIARGVKNVIITLGGEVSPHNLSAALSILNYIYRVSSTKLQSNRVHHNQATLFLHVKLRLLTQQQLGIPSQVHIQSQ